MKCRGLALSGAAKLSLSMQSTTLLKNKDKRDSVLQLHKRDQLQDLNGKMASLKAEACQPFVKVGKACKNDCAGELRALLAAMLTVLVQRMHMYPLCVYSACQLP